MFEVKMLVPHSFLQPKSEHVKQKVGGGAVTSLRPGLSQLSWKCLHKLPRRWFLSPSPPQPYTEVDMSRISMVPDLDPFFVIGHQGSQL